ncbi:MAG: IS66 family transposase [Methylocella sp.]
MRFASDGCLKMSNIAAERASRPIALGRKNFLLVPTPADGVRRSSAPSSRPPAAWRGPRDSRFRTLRRS